MFKKMFIKANGMLMMLFVNTYAFSSETMFQDIEPGYYGDADALLPDVIVVLLGLFLLAFTVFPFILSVASALTAFREWQQQKLDLGEMLSKVGVSIFLLAIIIVIIWFTYVNFPDS